MHCCKKKGMGFVIIPSEGIGYKDQKAQVRVREPITWP